MRLRFIFCTVLAIILADATALRGQFVWTGAGPDNQWTTGSNWLGGAAPGAGSDAWFSHNVGNLTVGLNSTVTVNSIFVGNPSPAIDYNYGYHYQTYLFNSAGPVTLNVGSGGIETSDILARFGSQIAVNLTAAQIWYTSDQYYDPIQIDGTLTNNGFTLTKSGYGELILNGSNNLTGTVNFEEGLLTLGNNNALGTATLNVLDWGTLQGTGNLTLNNPIILGGELDISTQTGSVNLTGPISVPNTGYGYMYVTGANPVTLSGAITLSGSLELDLAAGSTLNFTGSLASGGTPQAVYLYDEGTLLLNGTVAANAVSTYGIYSGKVIFGAASALPAGSTLISVYGDYYSYGEIGYAGLGVSGISAATFLAGFNKTVSTGSLGFDNGVTITGPVDLTGFNANARLGSATTATLDPTATITPQVASYNFGGGGGTLTVNSNLTGTNSLSLYSSYNQPLSLVLGGTNSFTGGVTISDSILRFASAAAFPASGTIAMASTGAPNYNSGLGYVGFAYGGVDLTSPAASAALAARFSVPTGSNLILGFDTPGAGSISSTIDLSAFPATTYLGTSTTLTVSGSLVPAGGGAYRFAAVKDGHLTVASNLAGSGGATIGLPLSIDQFPYPDYYVLNEPYNDDYLRNLDNGVLDFSDARSTVTLTGNNSALTGTVTLQGGRLEVGNNQALGTGTLLVDGQAVLATVSSGLILPNAISINNALGLDSTANNFTLAGSVTGYGLVKLGTGTVSLSGPVNIYSYLRVQQGTLDVANGSFLSNDLYLNSAGVVNFHAGQPEVEYLYGDPGATINLDPGTNLEVLYGGYYAGTIAGSGGLAVTSVGALELTAANSYSGGTAIDNGLVVARVNGALGPGPVQIANNGALALGRGVTFTNNLTFTSGMIGGSGIFAPANGPITVGNGRIVAPGLNSLYAYSNSESGALGFTSGLTLASGGAYLWSLMDAGHVPGGGWSLLDVSGALAITSTAGAPFTLMLNPGGYYYYDYTYIENFNPTLPYSWVIAQASGGITGFTGTNIVLDTTGFATLFADHPLASFSLSQNGNNLTLNFSPVPEPSTYALMIIGLVSVGASVRRRNRFIAAPVGPGRPAR